MKLQAQYNRMAIVSCVVALLLAGIGYFFLLHYVLLEQLDNALRVEKVEIKDHIKKHHSLPEATVYKDQRISFEQKNGHFSPYFQTRWLDFPEEGVQELSRQLIFPVQVGGVNYVATITKSQEATEKLIAGIALATLGLIVLLVSVLFLVNRRLVEALWRPFHTTLAAMQAFDLTAPAPISLPRSAINEFNQLNNSVQLMTEKVIRDYRSLKDFTDHASHEMQTPLAVINSRLDLLIQNPRLDEEQLQQVQGVYNSVEKLSRLSGSLLLLAKIGNNQFTEVQEISITGIVQEKVGELSEWFQSKALTVRCDMQELRVHMDRHLADILVGNLLVNAIRHTGAGGTIEALARERTLFVSNTGSRPLDRLHIFDRFYKSDASEGTGLGLAIVKQISDQYGFALSYDFKEGRHLFAIGF